MKRSNPKKKTSKGATARKRKLAARRRALIGLVLIGSVMGLSVEAAVPGLTLSSYLTPWLSHKKLVFDGMNVPMAPLRNFYAMNDYRPLWTDEDGLTSRGRAALAQLEKAHEEGLSPELYGVSSIRRVAAMEGKSDHERLQIQLSLELMMSRAALDYVRDMHAGFTRPQGDMGQPTLTAEEQVAVLKQIAQTWNVAEYLRTMAPQTQDYVAMKNTLKQYRTIAARGGWVDFNIGKTIQPGAQDARMLALREILQATGDLSPSAAPPNLAMYDAVLVEAVQRFQARHGIEADGIVTAATQKELAVPVEKRIEQLTLTMERMRWMPRDIGNRYVMVNLPAYRLWAVSGNKQLQMDVIVGSPSNRTPLFSKAITDVVINPSWGVPNRIAVNEMLPKIQEDSDYLARAGYRVTQNGVPVDPDDVDWSSFGDRSANYALHQPPGDGNALGKVKFLIPDSDGIYLHDTSQPKLFALSERSLSHGCVRLSEPEKFTQFVLANEGWSEQKTAAAYESKTPLTVKIQPLPVHLVYWTSWVDARGAVHFVRDVYGMDKTLLASMNNRPVRDDTVIKLAMN